MTVMLVALFAVLLGFMAYLSYKRVSFAWRVSVGTVLGACLGLFIQYISGFPDDPMKVVYIKETVTWFSLIGGGFIDLIRMLVVPLVFISIVNVILQMDGSTNLKRLVSLTATVNFVMVAIAAIVGLVLGNFFGLGQGFSVIADGASKMREISSIVATFRALIPNNPINAMAQTHIIAVVIFGIIFAAVARLIKTTGTHELPTVTKLFFELHTIVSWMADFIIGLMPYGVLALLASTLAQKGFAAILQMGLFIVLIYVGVGIMLLVQAVLLILFGLSPVSYFKKAQAPLFLAFTSRSSMGVLPLTVETLTNKLGVHPTTANTVASFGTTAGMQGCAGVFPALCVVYVANISGVPFDISMYIMSVLVIAIGSIGIAGVPGTATMAASVSLSGTGLGSFFASISPILAIDPIIDMGRTMLNVSGAMTNAVVIDKMMGTHNTEAYNSAEEVSVTQA